MELMRGVDPAMLTALSGPFHPVAFAWLDWPDAPVWAHTGVGQITWGGHDWQGVGPIGGLDIPTEGLSGVATAEAVLSLIGVPADLGEYGEDLIRGRSAEIWVGVVAGRPGGHDGIQTAGPGNTLIGAPVRIFSGTMDVLDFEDSAVSDGVQHEARVTVSVGPGARSMASISHSDEDQRRRYPGDTAGRLVILSFARAQKLTWPES